MEFPAPIRRFILKHHVLSLATVVADEPWAASCFYALDEARASLIILSASSTLHGAAMLSCPQVAGTIAGQPRLIPMIRGIQFRARAILLDGEDDRAAMEIYCRRHPVARIRRSSAWRLELASIKFTDNSQTFGSKLEWARPGADA